MTKTKKLTISAVLLALALILPFFTSQLKALGQMLLPMHLPVLLAGYIVGGPWAAFIGALAPLIRHFLWGMPPLNAAVSMTFELATYGFVSGYIYGKSKKKNRDIFISLVAAMIAGRAVWGIVSFIVNRALGNPFTLKIFMAGAFINALPGIILQLIAVPVIVTALKKSKII